MWRRYAFVRQNDGSDCGAAALATIARHYRRPVGLEQLRELAGTDRAGTNLRGLLRAAQKLGFSAKGVKGSYEALLPLPLPAVAHVTTAEGLGHYVVLYRVRKNAVVVADPASGIQKQSREEFCQRWTGRLLLVVPEPTASRVEKSGAAAGPWRRF
jgi:ATP-binding cassette subfamily B protein